MPITIGSNIAALQAQRRLGDATSGVLRASERLASGLRINRASDDAAGLSIASSLHADSRIFSQAIRNVNDGISALHIVEGAATQLVGLVTRLRELAEQSANGTYSRTQRLSLGTEADALVSEFNRVTQTTKFNGLSLLDLSIPYLTIQAGRGSGSTIGMSISGDLRRSTGTGSFSDGLQQVATGSGSSWAESADINGDGHADLITGSLGDGTVSVQLGRGDGTLDTAVTYAASGGINLRQGSLVDANRDGKLDMLVTSSDGTALSVLIGNGDGSFKAYTSYANSGGAWGLGAGDINGDGILDVVVSSHTTSHISIYIGNGDGTFRARSTIANTGNSNGVALADVNGDGKLDILSSTQGGGAGMDVFLGAGNGSFSPRSTVVFSGSFNVRVGDFNRDGIVDVVADNGSGSGLSIMIGNGDGTFKLRTVANSATSRGVRVADLNGDGYDDIITSSETDPFTSVHLGNGDGTFKARLSYALESTVSDITLADFNEDGALDIYCPATNSQKVFGGFGITQRTTSIQYLNIMTQSGARDALNLLDGIQSRLLLEIGSLGSHQSRLGVALRTLAVAHEGYRAAESRIMSADMAEEAADLIRKQILQQAAVSVLGQANLQPQIALSLLR